MSYQFNRLVFAAAALVASCQGGSQGVSALSERSSSSRLELLVRLFELTENPTPLGLPRTFVVSAAGLPRAGQRVAVAWRATDGEAAPREGFGWLERDEQSRVVATLTAPGRGAAEVLTLVGTTSGDAMRGTFGDRLYFRRAGRFEAQVRQQ